MHLSASSSIFQPDFKFNKMLYIFFVQILKIQVSIHLNVSGLYNLEFIFHIPD